MKKQEELLKNFQTDELEQRFEMGWKLKKGEVKYNGNSSWDGIQ